MRKLLSLLALVALAAAVWFGARAFVHRHEARVTVVFDRGAAVRPGDPVVLNGNRIGRVVRVGDLDGSTAVTVRLDPDHRRSIVTDSLFAVDGHQLVVTNALAVGRPVEDGAIVRAKEDVVSRWIAKHGRSVESFVDKARSRADQLIDRDFDQWTAHLPDWKREGSGALDRHVAEVRQRVEKAQADLRSKNQIEEAKRLGQRFEKWLEGVTH